MRGPWFGDCSWLLRQRGGSQTLRLNGKLLWQALLGNFAKMAVRLVKNAYKLDVYLGRYKLARIERSSKDKYIFAVMEREVPDM
jgi:hypothetical protein